MTLYFNGAVVAFKNHFKNSVSCCLQTGDMKLNQKILFMMEKNVWRFCMTLFFNGAVGAFKKSL